MKSLIILSLLCLFTLTSVAEDSIVVFYDNQYPIKTLYKDIEYGALTNAFLLKAHNIDEKNNATAQINRTVKQIVESKNYRNSNMDIKEIYQSGFNELINNEAAWLPIYKSLEEGGKTLSLMISFNIKKVPAFVFNEKDIVYGVNSIEQALSIYRSNKAGNNQ